MFWNVCSPVASCSQLVQGPIQGTEHLGPSVPEWPPTWSFQLSLLASLWVPLKCVTRCEATWQRLFQLWHQNFEMSYPGRFICLPLSLSSANRLRFLRCSVGISSQTLISFPPCLHFFVFILKSYIYISLIIYNLDPLQVVFAKLWSYISMWMPAGFKSRIGVLIEWESIFCALGSVCSELEFSAVCPLCIYALCEGIDKSGFYSCKSKSCFYKWSKIV